MTDQLTTRCLVVGGGPAGMMVGYLMARAGIETTVIEKHADFLRDFRGDTVHPSTMRIMDELGLLAEFLKRPHSRVDRMEGFFGTTRIRLADLRRLKVKCPYIAFMPQWEFLDFLAQQGKKLPKLKILMQTEATGLIEEAGRIKGVDAKNEQGSIRIHAELVIGADGRHSLLRQAARLEVEDIGAPIDVLWFRLSRDPSDTDQVFGHIQPGRMLVTLDRGAYWQCAFVIPKGGIERVKAVGLEAFQSAVAETAPNLAGQVGEIKSWDDVKLLTVAIDRLQHWSKPGLLCIGDAAHAMSPVGGVGINLAIQDAVATANILAEKLGLGPLSEADLDQVRKRRLFPTKVIQMMQTQMQKRLLSPIVTDQAFKMPLFLKILNALPILQTGLAYMIGIGVRSEHVRSPRAMK